LFGNFLTALVYFASLFEMTDEKWHMLYIWETALHIPIKTNAN
jgi:hypothetical protein